MTGVLIMTEEQKKLAADNHGLIYSFLRGSNLDEEEFYGIAAIGLCKAAMSYEADIAKFSTYAYRCMLTAVSNEFKIKNASKRIPDELITYYNADVSEADKEMVELIEYIPSKTNIEKEVLDQLIIDKCLKRMNDKERLIFRLLIEGYTMREIAKIMGCCYQNIAHIKLGIVRKLIRCRDGM